MDAAVVKILNNGISNQPAHIELSVIAEPIHVLSSKNQTQRQKAKETIVMPRHRRHFPPDTASQYYIVLCTKVFCQYTFHCPETTHNNLPLKLPLSLHFHQTYFILILTLITIHHSAPRQPKSKAIPLSPCTERNSVSYKHQNTVVSFLCQTACQTGSFHSLAHSLPDRLFPFFGTQLARPALSILWQNKNPLSETGIFALSA